MDLDQIRAKISSLAERLAPLGIKSLSLFGSTARGEAGEGSDLDFLVEFHGAATFARYMDLRELLEAELGKPVDLVTVGALKAPIRQEIEAESVRVA
jgi:predicted nucleotidyltransferase